MVIGDGLIASVFKDSFINNSEYTIFASGVSNSKELDSKQYLREKRLILEHVNLGSVFVYFSTCSIYESLSKESVYVKHKLEMEQLIKNHCDRYLIFRLPQVAGFSKNNNTLMNYLSCKIRQNEKFELFDVERNIIDVYDIYRFVKLYLEIRKNNQNISKIVNFAFPQNIRVLNLVEIMELFYNKKANYTISMVENYSFKIELDESLVNGFFNSKLKDYIIGLLKKYYN